MIDYELEKACERMMKRGWCGAVFWETLAEFMGEAGNESPSYAAIKKGIEWEMDEQGMIDFIVSSHKWCINPTYGCHKYCEMWKDNRFHIFV